MMKTLRYGVLFLDPRLTQLSVSIAVISLLVLDEQMRDHTTTRFIAIPDLKDEHAWLLSQSIIDF
ncbi:hypothetical protein Q8F57_042095 [Paraburkholderia terrae]|jgi:hypothetical protein|uniref:hypothetical protein n=1 Tax=Paraburkholderia terrae TaxID=311230 RepID=UPI00296AFDB4|nr:hypothetical protein [Paraburkholderia terrae]MDW3660181.1 hypothetical protein [Paraburkholderia terrae]